MATYSQRHNGWQRNDGTQQHNRFTTHNHLPSGSLQTEKWLELARNIHFFKASGMHSLSKVSPQWKFHSFSLVNLFRIRQLWYMIKRQRVTTFFNGCHVHNTCQLAGWQREAAQPVKGETEVKKGKFLGDKGKRQWQCFVPGQMDKTVQYKLVTEKGFYK